MSEKFNINGKILLETQSINPLDESTYVRNFQIRKKINHLMSYDIDWNRKEKFRNIRHTRLKLDIFLPL